jgi:uncharacterized LabA/DUF88 family protein
MRTLIQLDVQNLFFSAKDMEKRIDFLKIKEYFYGLGDDIVGMIAYIVRSNEIGKSYKFENFLKSIGYTLNIKTAIVTFKPGGERLYKGTDQDMSICVDCMHKINDFDKWILMSGDGDFIDLVKHLKEHKKTVEVWSLPGVSFNKRFCDYVDSIHFLNENFFYYEKDKKEKI